MKDNSSTRCRNWSIIIYPESCPSNWIDILNGLHIEWVQSPLHDMDVNADGELKKPHWHILLMFGGVKSYEQIIALTEPLNCPIPQRVHNSKALVRYMLHIDNPEKHQYSQSELKPYGGVDLRELLRPTSSERYSIIKDMIAYIRDNSIVEFQDLMDYASSHEEEWFILLCDNSAFVVNSYIKSARHRDSVSYQRQD